MVEASLKRHRDVVPNSDRPEFKVQIIDSESDPKKQKLINQMLSIQEQNEDESDYDLTSLISSLENEIICTLDFDSLVADPLVAGVDDGPVDGASRASKASEDVDDDKEKVIRHLLEASDDELGLPASKSTDEIGHAVVISGGYSFGFCEYLWELEDEAANYYTLLQSDLCM